MEINFLALFVAALSTLVIGFVWYHPKVFGTIWMKESGLTEENLKGGNMLLLFLVAFESVTPYKGWVTIHLSSIVVKWGCSRRENFLDN